MRRRKRKKKCPSQVDCCLLNWLFHFMIDSDDDVRMGEGANTDTISFQRELLFDLASSHKFHTFLQLVDIQEKVITPQHKTNL